MKEAISNAFLFNLAITFVIILLALFISALSYTKASKVRTRIIEEIEKYGEIAKSDSSKEAYDIAINAFEKAQPEIDDWLRVGPDGKGIGYRITERGYTNCPTHKYKDNKESTNIHQSGTYEYCIYRIDNCSNDIGELDKDKDKCGVYYHVITYMYFNLPLAENFKIPINGDTKTFTIRNN